MNRYCLALCSSALLLTMPAFADVELSMPSNSELLVVNGNEVSTQDTLKLQNGVNQIAFRYTGRYQNQGSQTQFQSDVIIIKFNEKNAELALTLPRIRSSSAADKFNQSPKVMLVDANDQSIHFEQGKLIKEGLQLGRDYAEEITAYNLTEQSASLQLQTEGIAATQVVTAPIVASITQAPPKPNMPPVEKSEQINVGQMLDFWYQQADEETREAFKKRIESK